MRETTNNRKTKLIFVALLALVIGHMSYVPVAFAIGISVTPSRASIIVAEKEDASIRLKVANPSKDVALFEVYPDALEQLISISPKSFTLESGAERFVEVSVRGEAVGKMVAEISVVARPLGDQTFQAGTGVKVPLAIEVVPTKNGLASAFGAVATSPWTGAAALSLLVGFAAYKVGGRRKEKEKLLG